MSGQKRSRYILLILVFLCVIFVQPGYAKEKATYYDEPNFQIDIGECVWNGTKSITQITFTLTNTKAEVFLPTGGSIPLKMSNPIVTVGLESGTYNYVWWDDFDPVFYIWKTRVEGSFTLNGCQPQANATITIGTCTWSESSGSKTPVTIILDHARLTLNGIDYTQPQTIIDLAPGTYPYSWVGIDGYQGGESDLNLTIPDCAPAPASASIMPGVCNWTEDEGSSIDVGILISGASLTISGSTGTYGPYTASTTVALDPGSYTYSWTALPGYTGSGSGSFILEDCEPEYGSASIEAGACGWDEAKGSTFPATITLHNATLTIHSATYTSSTTIQLDCGTYLYTWTAKPGYQGGGSGSITVEGCEPASVDVVLGACDWIEETSMTPAVLNIHGATLTLFDGGGGILGVYGPGAHSVNLPMGSYSYTWVANENFTGSGEGTFETLDCEPGKADASISIGACSFDDGKSLTLVSINVSGAVLTIDGHDYSENAEIKLEPSDYDYSWVALSGFEGSGNGTIHVGGCEPASVDVALGACDWIGETSMTPAVLNIHGATLTLFSDNGSTLTQIGVYGPGAHTVNLPMGSYAYSWVAIDDFTGSGEGAFETLDCEPGKADASVSIGACTYSDGNSFTLVTITVNGAILTIDGQDYPENAELKLMPGEYPYSWAAVEGYEGEGEGILTVDSCKPKGGEDSSPDVAAGGSGPSLILTLAPAFIIVSTSGLAWIQIRRRIRK